MKTQNTNLLLANYKELRSKAFFPETQNEAKEEITSQLDYFSTLGLNTYIIGLVDNFDISFANILAEYREQHPETELIIMTHEKSIDFLYGSLKVEFKKLLETFHNITISRNLHDLLFYQPNSELIEELNMKVIYYHQFGDGGVLYGYNRETDHIEQSNLLNAEK